VWTVLKLEDDELIRDVPTRALPHAPRSHEARGVELGVLRRLAVHDVPQAVQAVVLRLLDLPLSNT